MHDCDQIPVPAKDAPWHAYDRQGGFDERKRQRKAVGNRWISSVQHDAMTCGAPALCVSEQGIRSSLVCIVCRCLAACCVTAVSWQPACGPGPGLDV
jgi:hypothetical protein